MQKAEKKHRLKSADIMVAKLEKALAFAPAVKPAQIAKLCGVTAQAVSGWRKTGRVDKNHIAKISSLTGIALKWWFDGLIDSAPISDEKRLPTTSGHKHSAQEPLAMYDADPTINRLLTAFDQLTRADKERHIAEIEESARRIRAILDELGDSPAALAFKEPLTDGEVVKRLKLKGDHP